MDAQLRDLIHDALKQCFIVEHVSFVIEFPTELSHGDFATNVALVVSNELGKNPKEIADTLIVYLNEHKTIDIKAISIAGPGFINFTLSSSYFYTQLSEVVALGDKWGVNTLYKGKKILVEHSSPNLFKPFHVGHLMNNAIGESVTRLAKNAGAHVETMTFPSDVSLGIAKAIFILLETYGRDFTPNDIEVLGNAYVDGTKRYDEDEIVQGRVKEIADNLYAQTHSPEWELFQKCKAFNISYFETITAQLGSHFDHYIYESEAGVTGKAIVLKHTPGIFTESEGAIVYIPGEEKKHLNTAVFINSQGNPTYEAKDIGLLSMKFERTNPDMSVFITDSHQIAHFNIVLDAAEKIEKEWKEKSLHKYHGRMSLKGKKMSSRLGGVPLAKELIDAVSEEVHERSTELSSESIESVAIGALKFSILRTMAGKDINFDPETSLSFVGDSGPYLQYTAVRTKSVIDKAREQGIEASVVQMEKVTDVERIIDRFPYIVKRATSEWAPHHIVGYLLELAQAFNSWYATTKIIDIDTAAPHRLAIADAVHTTLVRGLHLLAIPTPEKM